jgi:hypothetical protein
VPNRVRRGSSTPRRRPHRRGEPVRDGEADRRWRAYAEIRRAIGPIELDVHAFDAQHAYVAGILRNPTRTFGLSFGDQACLALAQSLGVLALTADRSWSRLDLDIAIEVIRCAVTGVRGSYLGRIHHFAVAAANSPRPSWSPESPSARACT